MNPLLEQFLLEARENLAFIDQNIEKIGGDDPELLNGVFRAAHTLKGGSGIVGFEAVKTITHHAEDLLDMLRSGKIDFQPAMIESLYNAFDEVMNLIEAAEECGDIVEADQSRIDEIAEELSALVGKSIQKETVWSCPFNLVKEIQDLVNIPIPFLGVSSQKIPFKIEMIDQSVCNSAQLYAISFDVDESCMVYGNDPLYTLSLLGESVLGIYSCMNESGAKSVISGFDDPDGLLLKIQLTAYVYNTYDEISNVLYNFMDEIYLYPLDIATLLEINSGEENHTLDILKELSYEIVPSLNNGDRNAIREKIASTLSLIGKNTIQSSQLSRISAIIGMVDDFDLNKLQGIFNAMYQGKRYSYDPSIQIDTQLPATEFAEEMAEPSTITLTDSMKKQVDALLEQQLMALEVVDDESVVERVSAILHARLSHFIDSVPASFDSRQDLTRWINQYLKGEELNTECENTDIGFEPDIETPVFSTAEIVPPTPEPIAEPVSIPVAAPLSDSFQSNSIPAPKPVITAPVEETLKNDDSGHANKKSVIGKTVKIEQESIDNLMNIVGELLVAKNSLPYLAEGVHAMNSESIRRSIMEKYTFINRLAEQLQDLIMSMRMLPISYVFDRYPKLVRDISKNLGKKVNLTMEGGETTLDKNMIEMLADPMIHIMRNSLDHGIESPEIRVQKGKTAEGNIELNAYAQSDKIVIEIRDDGAGINIDRVVQKVLEKGLLTLDQIDSMSDEEKPSLVMLPGLSTAETISEYSGRGVGMDVVKKSIENFGGTIRIKTIPNRGTTIILSIPVSLAVTSLLHVSMSGVHYGFPMDSVSETVKIDPKDLEYLHNEPYIYIRGEVIPLLFAKGMLDESALAGKTLPIVVLNIKGNLLAVVVNELLGQLDVVQKPLEGIMENHPIFSGTALLGNGSIIMAIDPMGMLQISHLLKTQMQQAS